MRAEPLHSGVTMLLLAACAAILAWPDVARIANLFRNLLGELDAHSDSLAPCERLGASGPGGHPNSSINGHLDHT